MSAAVDARWQLRFGGLPASVVRELEDPAHRDSFGSFWDASRHLSAAKQAVSDALHGLISARREAGAETATLVALRRALFKQDADAVERRLAALTPIERDDVFGRLAEHAAPLRAWLAHERRHREDFDEMLAGQRTRLWEQVAQHGFLPGLALSAPDLVAEVDRYGRELAAQGRVDKRGKRVERSLVSYVTRAAAKTTPFSSLGPVAFPGATPRPRGEEGRFARSRWSVYPLARVLSAIAEDADLVAGVSLRRSPYVRRQDAATLVDRATWTFSEVDTRDDYAACVESRVRLPAEGVLTAVDEIMDRLGDDTTWGALTDELVDSAGLDHDRASDLVASLVRLGVLVAPALTIDAFDADAFDTTLEQIAGGGSRAEEIAVALRRYRDDAAATVDVVDPRERAAHVQRLRGLVADIYATAGITAEPPRSVVYEDVVFPASGSSLAEPLATSASGADALLAFVDLLDTSHVKRDLLNGYYRHLREAGEEVDDVAAFLRGFDVDLLESFEGYVLSDIADDALETDPWLRWGGAWRREAARRELLSVLLRHQRAVPFDGIDIAAELDAPPVDLEVEARRISATTSRLTAPFRHLNLLLQHDVASGVTVMNDCFGGVGFSVSRFSHVMSEPAWELTDDVERAAETAGVRLVEISGGTVFSNLNLHAPVLRVRLAVPGDPVRPGDSGIRLDDLAVRWSDAHERVMLVERATGMIVHPEYAGYLVPAATPRLHQSLSLLTPSASLSSKPADLLRVVPEAGTVVVRRRMSIGDVVVVRAAALLRGSDVPTHDPLTREGNLAWQRFWARHALPPRAYVRVLHGTPGRRAKPFFLDVTLALCLSNLHSQMRDAEDQTVLEITEALPDPHGAAERGDGSPRVAEAMAGISIIDRSTRKESV